jgi:hypothetical protein
MNTITIVLFIILAFVAGFGCGVVIGMLGGGQ